MKRNGMDGRWRTPLAMLLALVVGLGGIGLRPAAAADAQVFVDARIDAGQSAPGCGAHVALTLATTDGPLRRAFVSIVWRDGLTTLATAERLSSDSGQVFAWLPVGDIDAARLAVSVGGEMLQSWRFLRPAGEACLRGTTTEWLSRRAPLDAIAAVDSPLPAMRLEPFPVNGQDRNLSCEFASIETTTIYFGRQVSEYDVEAAVGYDPNPHKGFRGSIDGRWGNTTDYGVYNDALAPKMPTIGYTGDAFYAAGDDTQLKYRIAAGIPVIVWLAQQGDRREYVEIDGEAVTLLAGVHVMVAFAYDDTGVWVSDPAEAIYIHYDWEGFMWAWSLLDGMGLSITPIA
jgi:uncharacterized protein YvpB